MLTRSHSAKSVGNSVEKMKKRRGAMAAASKAKRPKLEAHQSDLYDDWLALPKAGIVAANVALFDEEDWDQYSQPQPSINAIKRPCDPYHGGLNDSISDNDDFDCDCSACKPDPSDESEVELASSDEDEDLDDDDEEEEGDNDSEDEDTNNALLLASISLQQINSQMAMVAMMNSRGAGDLLLIELMAKKTNLLLQMQRLVEQVDD